MCFKLLIKNEMAREETNAKVIMESRERLSVNILCMHGKCSSIALRTEKSAVNCTVSHANKVLCML